MLSRPKSIRDFLPLMDRISGLCNYGRWWWSPPVMWSVSVNQCCGLMTWGWCCWPIIMSAWRSRFGIDEEEKQKETKQNKTKQTNKNRVQETSWTIATPHYMVRVTKGSETTTTYVPIAIVSPLVPSSLAVHSVYFYVKDGWWWDGIFHLFWSILSPFLQSRGDG